jgi:hypothetical protein
VAEHFAIDDDVSIILSILVSLGISSAAGNLVRKSSLSIRISGFEYRANASGRPPTLMRLKEDSSLFEFDDPPS